MKSRFFKLVLSAVFLFGSLAAEEKQAKPPVRLTIEKRKNQIAYLDLEFARVGNVPVLMDLYVPTNAQRKPHVIVFFHGGSWRGGSKKTCHVHWLTQHGYAVASVG